MTTLNADKVKYKLDERLRKSTGITHITLDQENDGKILFFQMNDKTRGLGIVKGEIIEYYDNSTTRDK